MTLRDPTPEDAALARQLQTARTEGLTPAGHAATVEALAQIGDRLGDISAKQDGLADTIVARLHAERRARVTQAVATLDRYRWPVASASGLWLILQSPIGRALARLLLQAVLGVDGGGAVAPEM